METINERIMLIIKHFNLNKNSFSRKINLSSSAIIENIVSGRKSKPSYEVINKIISAFENVDANWLITGKGEMIKITEQNQRKVENISANVEESKGNYIKCLNCEHKQEIIDSLNERIEDLKLLVKSKDEIIELMKDEKKIN